MHMNWEVWWSNGYYTRFQWPNVELWLGPRGVLQIYGESEVQMGLQSKDPMLNTGTQEELKAGLDISARPLAQASVKTVGRLHINRSLTRFGEYDFTVRLLEPGHPEQN